MGTNPEGTPQWKRQTLQCDRKIDVRGGVWSNRSKVM